MNYSFLIFDADGTLFDFDAAEAAALKETCLAFGMDTYNDITHLQVYREINGIIWREFEEERISARELKPERFRRFFSRLDQQFDPHSFSDRYLLNLSKHGILLAGAEEFLRNLDNSFTTALLTNGLTKVQYPRYNNSILPGFIPHIVVSESVGVAKPNPKIFDIVFQEAGWEEKASALMIGDNLSSDIRGGLNYGIDTCWYNPDGNVNTTDLTPTYEIRSFRELSSILNLS